MNHTIFLDAYERGMDPTNLLPGDCDLYNNAPNRKLIPDWWLREEDNAIFVLDCIRRIRIGEAEIERSWLYNDENIEKFLNEQEKRVLSLSLD